MMKRMTLLLLTVTACCLLLCTGCEGGERQEEPVNITIWHVYGAQTESPLNDLIDRFNATVGKEEGVMVKVTMVSANKSIHENILASARGEPGTVPLPDLFMAYPKTVLAMPDENILVDYRDYFTPQELEAFVPAFVEEGTVRGRLVVLPVAKSTEVLYVNRRAFERFAEETGAAWEDLATWEGLFRTCQRYAEWTDALTPDRPGDGKAMLAHDFHFDYFQVGAASLGEDFFAGEVPAFGPAFRRAWEPYARAALSGGLWLRGGYATEPVRTGDAIVTVGSSAGVLYFSDRVTYPDNTSDALELAVLPCPVFEGGEKLAMQRGAGICTVRSTPERERACMVFLRWLTDPEVNVELVTQLGYMPVTREAFRTCLAPAVEGLKEEKYRALYRAYLETEQDYTFYTPPLLDGYLELEGRFEALCRSQLAEGRDRVLRGEDPEALLVPQREALEAALREEGEVRP